MAANPNRKRIVCLANSRKYGGRCIAGKEIAAASDPGVWVRPVSERPTGELNDYERQYRDRSEPQLLDVIVVPVLEPQPESYQRENWLLDTSSFWLKIGRLESPELFSLVDDGAPLWVNGYSSVSGRNDRIPQRLAADLVSSLRFIHVAWLELSVTRGKLAGRFRYDEVEYWLSITDPAYERAYHSKPNGTYPLGECFLTVSLGESYRGYTYKLVAAIIALADKTTIAELTAGVGQPSLFGG